MDSRFTRTSSKADIYAPLHSGTDIAFLGGIIKYVPGNKLYNEDYVVNYTNASFLVNKDYVFKDGLFSGFDPQKKSYNKSAWTFDNSVPCILIFQKHLSHRLKLSLQA